jgi:hypothetical protein
MVKTVVGMRAERNAEGRLPIEAPNRASLEDRAQLARRDRRETPSMPRENPPANAETSIAIAENYFQASVSGRCHE